MAGGTALLPRKRRLVALADNCDSAAQQDDPVLIASCISESSIARSGLLSGIAATDGVATLPSNLSPADVRLWETAQFVDTDISLGDMVTVVKVAEALGDNNVSTWVDELASQVANTAWSPSKPPDATLCSLLRLPFHLLPAVLSPYLSKYTAGLHPICGLTKALANLPPALHPAAFTATAASGDVWINSNVAEKMLRLLPFIPIPPPGLRSLSIHDSPRGTLESAVFMRRPSTGATLACALSTHPYLTSLTLTTTVSAQWLRSFIDCLAPGALRHVAVLSLHVTAHRSSCAEVAALLRLLPALTTLDIVFVFQCKKTAVPHEREAVPLSSYASLCGTPATLPHLARLNYTEWCQTAEAIGEPKDASATRFLSLLSAPALSIIDLTAIAPLSMPAFQAQLRRFRGVKEVHVMGTALPGNWVLPRLFGPEKLPELSRVSVAGQCPGSPMAIAAAIADLATSALTCMSVMHVPTGTEGEAPAGYDADRARKREEATSACCHFFEVLVRCHGLSRLTLAGMCGPAEGPDPRVCCGAMADAAPALSALTYLRLQPSVSENARMELDGHLIGSAVRGLPALEELSLYDGSGCLKFSPVAAVVDACGELKELPCLELRCDGITPAHVGDLLPQMDALRSLSVCDWVFHGAREELEELKDQFGNVRIFLE